MLPVLFRFRGTEIHAYPVFLFAGLTFGIISGTESGFARGLDATRLYSALLLLTIPALVGGRLLYALTHWRFYRQNPSQVWSPNTGGAALYGGLILALVCSLPLLRFLELPLGAFWDAATITLVVGVAFTKIGCLLNGCCAGKPTPGWLALDLPNASGIWNRRVPSQLLECSLALSLFCGAILWTARPFNGAVFLVSLAIFATARLALGATREKLDGLGGFNIYNAISVVLLLGSVGGIAIIRWARF